MSDVLYSKELINHTVVTTEVTGTDSNSQTSSNAGDGGNLLQSEEENSTDVQVTTEGETSADGQVATEGESITEGEVTPEVNPTTEGETGTESNGEAADTAVDSGEMQPDIIDDSGNSEYNSDMSGDMSGDMTGMEGMYGDGATTTTVKDPFLASYVPVIGITAATLVVGAVIGILLAKKKIKKGIDLYED